MVKLVHNHPGATGEALNRLLEIVMLLNQDAVESLAKQGLTVARARVMWLLHHNGPLTQKALADAMKVSPRNVTGLVDGLVETGFVTREPHPRDRRATHVSLTEHGAETMDAMDADHQALAKLLFGDMAERRFSEFARGLDDVALRLHYALER